MIREYWETRLKKEKRVHSVKGYWTPDWRPAGWVTGFPEQALTPLKFIGKLLQVFFCCCSGMLISSQKQAVNYIMKTGFVAGLAWDNFFPRTSLCKYDLDQRCPTLLSLMMWMFYISSLFNTIATSQPHWSVVNATERLFYLVLIKFK